MPTSPRAPRFHRGQSSQHSIGEQVCLRQTWWRGKAKKEREPGLQISKAFGQQPILTLPTSTQQTQHEHRKAPLLTVLHLRRLKFQQHTCRNDSSGSCRWGFRDMSKPLILSTGFLLEIYLLEALTWITFYWAPEDQGNIPRADWPGVSMKQRWVLERKPGSGLVPTVLSPCLYWPGKCQHFNLGDSHLQ